MICDLVGINFSYPNSTKFIFDQPLSLSVNSGDCIFINAEAGRGSTTFCRLLAGSLNPTIGKIIFSKNTVIHYVFDPQSILRPEWTISSNIRFFLSFYNAYSKSSCEDILRRLSGYNVSHRNLVRSLSPSQRKLIVVILLSFLKGGLLVLDFWPNCSLSPVVHQYFLQEVRNNYSSIIYTKNVSYKFPRSEYFEI